MGLHHLLTLLPLVAPLAHAQNPFNTTNATTTDTNITNATTPDATVSAPSYTPEECNGWISALTSSDEDSSNGLSESEYHSFLSSIEDPPYIAEYFGSYEGFDQLPWVFRVVHKSLACHCEKLGLGEECCEGDNAEVLLIGLDDSINGTTGNAVEEEYKDLFCQQISYVLSKSVPSPAPTAGPTASPSKSPSAGPTASPTTSPSLAPVVGPTTYSPVEEPTAAPKVPPTLVPTATPSISLIPTAGEEISQIIAAPETVPEDEKDDGIGIGGIIGIIVAILAVLLAIIALVVYRRQKNEEDELRKFAGDQAPEADLEAPPTAEEEMEQSPPPKTAFETAPGDEPEEDDESSEPSVWSDSEGEDTMDELHEDHEDPGVTAGSALAAMGAASTVAARISANPSQ
mmetsp:Transcript_34877/g.62784  ORF Transcript_34877/g.62784 Transcript_34877/m.62784 type:complete len:401 (+) Transcript_34877:123-1325(+)|eukprot:CAMPEP_0201869090 /NCGR_PEP_ID=MMETSP0902-20130614/2735_1 /ASSEMBLY_ACC=CAM_ASM_000551 /TAXON_ID=420261 /ORGANISM="Thalassiosira antarctica, Strain CCMP982" /LENGTH=400 /DNA_ID=CAMNT_0048394533 /DNA_START=373 /DNA_END=1575 /DNA_ORIENTATION=-